MACILDVFLFETCSWTVVSVNWPSSSTYLIHLTLQKYSNKNIPALNYNMYLNSALSISKFVALGCMSTIGHCISYFICSFIITVMELHHLYKFNESHSWIFISQMSFATLLFWCFSLFVFFMGSSLALFVLFLFLAYGQEICHCKRK